jgi:sirohydrochlorin ferrochelatase
MIVAATARDPTVAVTPHASSIGGTAAILVGVSALRPVLVAVAHGTRAPEGPVVVERLVDGVRELLPDVPVEVAYVDVLQPDLKTVLRRVQDPAVVVPLFLAAGYHVRVDVPRGMAQTSGRVRVAELLGPDPAVIAAVADRHRAALDGRRPDAVVLAAAGSSDPRARADVETAAERLQKLLAVSVTPAYVTSAKPRVGDAVAALRIARHRVVSIATYLLAPGLFARSLGAAGADAVASPIGAHPLIVDLVVRRYRDLGT